MSERDRPTEDTRMLNWMRNIEARIERLENGGAIAGRLSLASEIQIGDVVVTIVDAGGNSRTVRFRNSLTGSMYDIPLA